MITKVERELRYRLRCDTVESVKLEVIRDSIPYPVEVEVIKEIPRKRTWFDIICYCALGILLAYGSIKLSKLLKPPS